MQLAELKAWEGRREYDAGETCLELWALVGTWRDSAHVLGLVVVGEGLQTPRLTLIPLSLSLRRSALLYFWMLPGV